MSYYENKAQPLTKEDFNKAINALKKSKIDYPLSLLVVPPLLYQILTKGRLAMKKKEIVFKNPIKGKSFSIFKCDACPLLRWFVKPSCMKRRKERYGKT